MWRPRCRGGTGFCSSGYWTVIGFEPIFRSVNESPWTSSLITTGSPPCLCPQRDDRAGDDDVDQPKREQDFPPEVHEPVVAESRQRPAHPDHHEEEHRDLAKEPDRSGNPVEGMEREDGKPATEEERRRDRADGDHVDVLAEEVQPEAH